MHHRSTLLSLILTLLCSYSYGQRSDTTHLSLAETIARAQERGPLARMSRSTYRSRRANYDAFRASLLPQLWLNGVAPDFTRAINPIVQPDGTTLYVEQSQVNSTLALSLSQALPFSGGELFFSSGLTRTDDLADKSILWRSSPFIVGLRQPIFGMNTLAWNSDIEDLRAEEADRGFIEEMEDAALNASGKFFDVYTAALRYDNARLNVLVNDSLLYVSRGRFDVGRIDETELLQSELTLANARKELADAELDHRTALADLAISLSRDGSEMLDVVPPEQLTTVRVSIPEAIAHAKANRKEWTSYELELTSAERDLAQARATNGFAASVSATFGYNQTAPKLAEAYKDLLDQQTARLELSVPIYRFGRGNALIESAEANLDRTEIEVKMKRELFEKNVVEQVNRFLRSQDQVPLSMKADTIAQKQYELAYQRYLIGKIDITRLLLAQEAKDRARLSLAVTLREYWTNYYLLRKATLFDFTRNSKIEYPY
jgi:outer membrane protein TolC